MVDNRLKGRILKVEYSLDGLATVVVDNGLTNTISLVTPMESMPLLYSQDMQEIRDMVSMVPPGGYRRKGK